MAITNIRDLGIKSAEDNLFGHRNYTWTLQVECDDPKENPATIVNDARFVQKGWPLISPSFSDPRAVLVKLNVQKNDSDPRIHIYTQSFSTDIKFPSGDAGDSEKPGDGGNSTTPANWPDNPLLHPPSIRGYYVREMEPVEEDLRPERLGGPQPVVNTLGEALTPRLERTRLLPAIAVSINKATIDEVFMFAMQGAVNSGLWRGLQPGTVKHECEWKNAFDQLIGNYWTIDSTFVYNARGWNPTLLLNTSFNTREADPSNGRYRRVPIRDKFGQPTATAQPIDVNGKVITPPIIRDGTTTEGSAVITGLSDTTDLHVGDEVRGEGIPSNAGISTILTIDSGSQVTISDQATAAGTVSLTFGEPYYWLEFWEHPEYSFGTWPF